MGGFARQPDLLKYIRLPVDLFCMAEILFEILIANGPFPKSDRGKAIFSFGYASAMLIAALTAAPHPELVPIVGFGTVAAFVVCVGLALSRSDGRMWSVAGAFVATLTFAYFCRAEMLHR